jgi:hypothetical protein
MATENLKSLPITNLDQVPVVPNTTGEGGPGFLREESGYVVSTAGVTVGSTYRMVRLPTNAKVKAVMLTNSAHGGSSAFDIDVAYSDATNDQTAISVQGTIPQIGGVDNKLFGAAISAVSAQRVEELYANLTNFPYGSDNIPLWTVLGLPIDPGGMFDILLKSTTTDTSGGTLGITVRWVD